jgi:hypothetical protein
MKAFERGLTMVLVLWGMLFLLGYNAKRTRLAARARPESH